MKKKKVTNNASFDLGAFSKEWQVKAQKMERRELEEAILVELKVVQAELRELLKGKRPKNS